jgi:hypothetical protein
VIVLRQWVKSYDKGIRRYREVWKGWFLFGFIPLYLIRLDQESVIR